MEDPRNFPHTFRVIIFIWNMGGNAKVWDHLTNAKDYFLDIIVAQIGLPELKKLAQLCAGGVSVLLHPSFYLNAILDPKLDRRQGANGRSGNHRLVDLISEFGLVDR